MYPRILKWTRCPPPKGPNDDNSQKGRVLHAAVLLLEMRQRFQPIFTQTPLGEFIAPVQRNLAKGQKISELTKHFIHVCRRDELKTAKLREPLEVGKIIFGPSHELAMNDLKTYDVRQSIESVLVFGAAEKVDFFQVRTLLEYPQPSYPRNDASVEVEEFQSSETLPLVFFELLKDVVSKLVSCTKEQSETIEILAVLQQHELISGG